MNKSPWQGSRMAGSVRPRNNKSVQCSPGRYFYHDIVTQYFRNQDCIWFRRQRKFCFFLFRSGYQENWKRVTVREAESGFLNEEVPGLQSRRDNYVPFADWLRHSTYSVDRDRSLVLLRYILSGRETPLHIQYGIARNHRRRKRNENSEGKWGIRLGIADKDICKSRDGQMLHNEWIGFHDWRKVWCCEVMWLGHWRIL